MVGCMIDSVYYCWLMTICHRIQSYRRNIMLNYSSKSRTVLDVLQKGISTKENTNGGTTPEPRRIAFKPALIEIKKPSYAPYPNDATLTPKTSRTTYNPNAALNSSFSKSPHVTPDRQRMKKELSFVDIKAEVKDGGEEGKRLEFRNVENNERSRKMIKTVMFKESVNRQEEQIARLRQTVSNANSWLAKNNFPPKPIKSQIEFEHPDIKNDKSMRKKIESQYIPAAKTQPHDETPTTPTKFIPRNHLRNKTTFEDNETDPALKFKQQQSQNTTPRISQEKLTRSVNLKLNNPMNKTDPSGGYFQRAATKRLSSTITPRIGLSLDDFQLGPCKGEGRFGKVFPARHKRTGFLLAVKQVKKESVRLMLEQFIQQVKISLFLNHANVVKFYGFFHDTLHFYILMEYMEEGSLYRLVKNPKHMPEAEVASKMAEVCQAVSYLHSLDILHRDIKPENIVLSNGVCKLCDFGWAAYSKERRTTYCGTLDYVCPEILEGQSYDSLVDIWAIGVLAFEMLTGKAPFYHISRQETMKSIMKCDFGFPEEMSAAARSFITKSLQKSPDRRVTIEQLLKERFVSEAMRGIE